MASSRKGDSKFFHFSVVKYNQYETIDYYTYFSVIMQEMDLHVDETLLNALLGFINVCTKSYYKSTGTESGKETLEYIVQVE